MEQLRYGGVLEAVRVARSGYPVRLPHKVGIHACGSRRSSQLYSLCRCFFFVS